jgi:beta-glucosidase
MTEPTGWTCGARAVARPRLLVTMAMLLSVAAVLATTSAVATASAAPPAGGDPRARAEALLKQMTLEEKITLLHGPPTGPCCQCKGNASCAYVGNVAAIPRLKIPPITMNDGPQGFRDNNQPGSTTAWPSGLTMAASWSTDAMMDWGVGMGKEFYNKGSNVQLGPGLCLARVPRNGRNFEYLSGEDPMLGYVLSQPAIKGIQSEGVIANAKHYIMNDQASRQSPPPRSLLSSFRFCHTQSTDSANSVPLFLCSSVSG